MKRGHKFILSGGARRSKAAFLFSSLMARRGRRGVAVMMKEPEAGCVLTDELPTANVKDAF